MVGKEVIAYVKASLNYMDIPLPLNKDLIYILNKPYRYISRELVVREGMSFDKLIMQYSHNNEVANNIDKLKFDLAMIARLNPSAAMIYIRNGVGYEKYLHQYGMENNISISILINQLEEITRDASKYHSLQQWIENLHSEKNTSYNTNNNGVRILTMHVP